MGIPPSSDPKANELNNSNMPPPEPSGPSVDEMDGVMNEVLDGLSSDLDKIAGGGSV
jgi:hypothetical protein